jgi:enoyl-CoA hydratase/carnithine racemase
MSAATAPAARYARDPAEPTIGVITLDRPASRNSMTPELLDAFAAASAAARAEAESGALRAVVITGAGPAFCTGADLNQTLQRDGDLRAAHERSYAMYEPFLSILDVVVPVVGALNGHAIGGGFGLALACDVRIGAEDARYGANFVRLGLGPGMAITHLLPRLIGLAAASELLLTGRLVDGRTAERLGIVSRAVPAADVLPTALALAREIAAAAPQAVRATKRALRGDLAGAARHAARAEALMQAETLGTADAREGVAALLGKRLPVFTGR